MLLLSDNSYVLKRVFDFFVFSSVFITLCAVLMVYQTASLFHLPLSFALIGFVFSGTVCSYNFHWYLTPPGNSDCTKKIGWNIKNRPVHLGLFLAGLAGAIVFAFMLNHWFWLAITAFVTFLYSAPKIPHPLFSTLKKVAVGKTIFLAFAWMHVTVLLPMVLNDYHLSEAQICFTVNRFFFLYAICILFDYRDRDPDRKESIRSLITLLPERGIDILFWGSLFVFLVTLGILAFSFPWWIIAALAFPALLLCFLYAPAKHTSSDYFYYFVLDGFMMLSSAILVCLKFVR